MVLIGIHFSILKIVVRLYLFCPSEAFIVAKISSKQKNFISDFFFFPPTDPWSFRFWVFTIEILNSKILFSVSQNLVSFKKSSNLATRPWWSGGLCTLFLFPRISPSGFLVTRSAQGSKKREELAHYWSWIVMSSHAACYISDHLWGTIRIQEAAGEQRTGILILISSWKGWWTSFASSCSLEVETSLRTGPRGIGMCFA